MSDAITCPACSHLNEAGSRYCEQCGLAFQVAREEGAPGEAAAGPEAEPQAEEEADAVTAVTTPVARRAPAPVAAPAPTPVAPATPAWGAPVGYVPELLPPDDLPPAGVGVLITDFEPDVGNDVSPAAPAPAPTAPPAPAPPAEAPTMPIGEARLCARCGGLIARDGYCELCGEPAASARDHYRETPAPWVGGACDRGVVHTRNEDAMALGVLDPDGDVAVLVVCDGVSSSLDSDVASLAAARAAATLVLDGIRNVDGPSAEQIRDLSGLLTRAAVAANEAVVATTSTEGAAADNPPSCTYVAAAIDGPLVVTAWLGDSRAYWFPDDGAARQLSVDHSWAQEAIEGGMRRAEAETAPHAHAITRWLGADAPDLAARTDAMVAHSPGWVMVCSDGLWNYCSPAADLARLLAETAARVGNEPTTLSAELVTWANAQGGRDNITVALARIEP